MDVKIILFLSCFVTLICCTEKDANIIDVSSIQQTDNNGVPIGTTGSVSGQWASQMFTAAEIALFTDLDSVSLSNTIFVEDIQQYPAYPNPFQNYFSTNFTTNTPFTGDVVVKYVIVNGNMQSVIKKSKKLQSTLGFQVSDVLATGNYRLYFTFSATDNPHFYKSWGNIQKR